MSVTAEQSGNVWQLRSMGEPCGPRLRKSDPWPLRDGRPFDYHTKAEALIAADKLEKYLAKHLVKK